MSYSSEVDQIDEQIADLKQLAQFGGTDQSQLLKYQTQIEKKLLKLNDTMAQNDPDQKKLLNGISKQVDKLIALCQRKDVIETDLKHYQ